MPQITLSRCPCLNRNPAQHPLTLTKQEGLLCIFYFGTMNQGALALLPCLLAFSCFFFFFLSSDHGMRNVFVFFSREAESEPSFFLHIFFPEPFTFIRVPPKATNSQDSPLTSFPLCLPLSLCSTVNSQDTNYHSSLQLAWGEAAGI